MPPESRITRRQGQKLQQSDGDEESVANNRPPSATEEESTDDQQYTRQRRPMRYVVAEQHRKRLRGAAADGAPSYASSSYDSNDSQSDLISETASNRMPHSCQSCGVTTSHAARFSINLHHQVNPFYSSLATYHMVQGTSWSFLAPSIMEEEEQVVFKKQVESSTSIVPNSTQPVSLKPTTAAIPEESVYLCQPCAMRFRRLRMKCDHCFHVPRLEERYVQYCSRCFEGVITRH